MAHFIRRRAAGFFLCRGAPPPRRPNASIVESNNYKVTSTKSLGFSAYCTYRDNDRLSTQIERNEGMKTVSAGTSGHCGRVPPQRQFMKESLLVQTKGNSEVSIYAPADQFLGVTKLIVHGKGSGYDLNEEATQ